VGIGPLEKERHVMRIHRIVALALAIGLLFIAPAAWAQRQKVTLHKDGVLQGVHLAAGTYAMELAPSLDSAVFYKGRKLVLTAPCRVESLTNPAPADEIHYRDFDRADRAITRIVLARENLLLTFGEPGSARETIQTAKEKGRGQGRQD
jgi:LPS O-antigen subunit length determinant protein (WzzB/FepE family)